MRSGDEQTSSDDADPLWGAREWLLLSGPRLHVAGVVVLAFFAFLTALSVSGFVPYSRTDPLYYVYSGLISGNLTLITVVVAINQLLLSREFHTPGELESQIESIEAYRSDVESMIGQVAPVQPSGFLRLLVEGTRRQAQRLGGLAVNETDDEVRSELDSVLSELTAQADHVDDLVRRSETSTFQALSATITTNYAPKIRRLRRIERRFDDELTDDVSEAIDELVDRIESIDVARQYFKTLYLQEELATLSRQLFYVGLISVPVVLAGLLLLTASRGASVPTRHLRVLAPAILTVGISPLALLFAFIVRVATVTQRTVSTIPFTTASQER